MNITTQPASAFAGLMALERKHGLFELDATCRALVETVFERESRGETTVAEDLIEASDMSRATVYRKIKTLTENGALVEAWADHRLTYVIGANVREFCNEIAVKEAAAAAWDKMTFACLDAIEAKITEREGQ